MGSCCSCCSDDSERKALTKERRSSSSGGSTDPQQAEVTDGVPIPVPSNPRFHEAAEAESEMSPVLDLILPAIPKSTRPVHIVYIPPDTPNQCAYCNDPTGDRYDYIHVPSIPCDLLEDLMEHGWWRTGVGVFKPRFDIVCCPGYATRLPVQEYVLNKKHRRVIRKWGEFLKLGNPRWENRKTSVENDHPIAEFGEKRIPNQTKRKVVTPGKGADPNKPPCQKAKQRRTNRQKHERINTFVNDQESPSLVDYINQHAPQLQPNTKHIFEVKLLSCNPRDPLLTATIPYEFELFDKFQTIVHPGKFRFSSMYEFEEGFCTSPLYSNNSTTAPQGSYHMQYYFNQELVMYSIVDILPQYFISIYFVYDPDIRFLCPGVFTCLYEISFVQTLRHSLPGLKYYGLGYYNHHDDKSSYKRQFKPQQVLCNETNTFVSLELAVPKILAKRYCQLADESVPVKEGRSASIDMLVISTRLIQNGRLFLTLSRRDKSKYEMYLKMFLAEVGSHAAHRFLVGLDM